MKYPYIGKAPINDSEECEEFDFCIFYKPSFGEVLESNANHRAGYKSSNWCEREVFTNITPEYLQNTYGKVVSPEHAEFIIELAELHGFKVAEDDFDKSLMPQNYCKGGEAAYFYTWENSCSQAYISFVKTKDVACNDGEKQITIPLPPKADKQDESIKQFKIGDEVETNLGAGHIRLMPDVNDNYIVLINGNHIPVNTVNVKKLEAPKQELSEWPQVGDDVVAVHENNNLKGKLLALTKKYAIISQGSEEQHLHLNAWTLEKPKTPEEDLLDELAEWIDRNNDVWKGENHYNPVSITVHEFIAGAIMTKYDVKKKPQ